MVSAKTYRNRKNRVRTKGSARVLELIRRQDGLCYWCKVPIVSIREVPSGALIKQTEDWITWRPPGASPCKRRRATVDHIIPVAEGGTSAWSNIVAACANCNRQRTAKRSPKTPEERRICPKCGGSKPAGRRKCDKCRFGDPTLPKPFNRNGKGGGGLRLNCIQDTCPNIDRTVDYRRCVGCAFYLGQKRMGTIQCGHPDACLEDDAVRRARQEAFRATAGVQHLVSVGPLIER